MADEDELVLPPAVPPRKSAVEAGPSRRAHIIMEIFSTEQTYIRSLHALEMFFRRPLYQTEAWREQLDKIFLSLEPIPPVHHELLVSMQNSLEKANNRHEDVLLGEIFGGLTPFLKVYHPYVNGFAAGHTALEELLNSSAKFRARLEECEADGYRGELGLASLKLCPIQRIPRYNLLLEQLVQHTPETHADYEALREAGEAVGAIAADINRCKRDFEQRERLLHWEHFIKVNRRLLFHPGPISAEAALRERHEWVARKGLQKAKTCVYCQKVAVAGIPRRPKSSSGSASGGAADPPDGAAAAASSQPASTLAAAASSSSSSASSSSASAGSAVAGVEAAAATTGGGGASRDSSPGGSGVVQCKRCRSVCHERCAEFLDDREIFLSSPSYMCLSSADRKAKGRGLSLLQPDRLLLAEVEDAVEFRRVALDSGKAKTKAKPVPSASLLLLSDLLLVLSHIDPSSPFFQIHVAIAWSDPRTGRMSSVTDSTATSFTLTSADGKHVYTFGFGEEATKEEWFGKVQQTMEEWQEQRATTGGQGGPDQEIRIRQRKMSVSLSIPEPSEMVGLDIRIEETIQVHSADGAFTAFLVVLQDAEHGERTLLKRYRQFHKLHSQLKQSYSKKQLPHLPQKRLFQNNLEDEFVRRRCQRLQRYLRLVWRLPGAMQNTHLVQFLDTSLETGSSSDGSPDAPPGAASSPRSSSPSPSSRPSFKKLSSRLALPTRSPRSSGSSPAPSLEDGGAASASEATTAEASPDILEEVLLGESQYVFDDDDWEAFEEEGDDDDDDSDDEEEDFEAFEAFDAEVVDGDHDGNVAVAINVASAVCREGVPLPAVPPRSVRLPDDPTEMGSDDGNEGGGNDDVGERERDCIDGGDDKDGGDGKDGGEGGEGDNVEAAAGLEQLMAYPTAHAIRKHQAGRDTELSMKEGEKFHVLSEEHGEWWYVFRPPHDIGFVPATFLRRD